MPLNPVPPGAYVAEAPVGHSPIANLPTSITAFLGSTKKGPVHVPQRVRAVSDFENLFGEIEPEARLGQAVRQFFLNGGVDAWVVRVAKSASSSQVAKALRSLDSVETLSLLALPAVAAPAILALASEYCRGRRALLLIDAPSKARTAAEIQKIVQTIPPAARSHVAVYFPWVRLPDPLNFGETLLTPPSGSIAGVLARLDAKRGVWKPPAGREATLLGIQRLDYVPTDVENQAMNTAGINCLRVFVGIEAAIWGARTLAGADLNGSEFKYIPVRRLVSHVEECVVRGLQWACFEPNDQALWTTVRESVEQFLMELTRQGALAGSTPSEGFFVKCDATTMTPGDIRDGRLVVLIGLACLRPAEFVLLNLVLKAQA